MNNKEIAPEIFRQRLLIESYFEIVVDENVIRKYFSEITTTLNLRTYSEPIIFSPNSGMGKDDNAGYDAFVPLIDSGISLYIWTAQKFFSVVIYTCKGFDEELAINFTKSFYQVKTEVITKSF